MRSELGAHRFPLRGFGVRNFKSFRDRQQIPIRPITLLFGKNNCGKSAMLRALTYARQLVESYSPGSENYTAEELVAATADVGRWPEFLHDPKKQAMSFFFDLPSTRAWHAAAPAGRAPLVTHELTLAYVARESALDEHVEMVRAIGVRKWLAGELLLSSDAVNLKSDAIQRLIDEALAGVRLTVGHPVSKELLEVLVKSHLKCSDDLGAFPPAGADYSQTAAGLRGPAGELWEGGDSDHATDRWGRLAAVLGRRPSDSESEGLLQALDYVARNLEQLWTNSAVALTDLQHRMSYLGPLRTIPDSVNFAAARSEATGARFWQQVAEDEAVRASMNQWLTSVLPAGERVNVHVELEGPGLPLGDEDLEDITARLLSSARRVLRQKKRELRQDPSVGMSELALLAPEELALTWAKQLVEASGTLHSARVLLRVDGVDRLLQPSEVGLGWTQFIPVLAAAAGSRGQLNLVEQPELHLHPALQAEAADVFIQSALGEKQNTWVIETHSEHLLLRIMRRIRETAHGRLPEGHLPITPEDVAVCFVERENDASVVHEIPLDENGNITRPWPGGFFEEGFREVFAW